MKDLVKIALGILTSIGGFLEAGSLGTALQAGSEFRYDLLWALLLGVICVAFLVEMTGRLAAVSKHTVVDAFRKRFGFPAQAWPLAAQLLVNFLVVACEIGGAAFALELATGVSMRVWAIPVAFVIWIVLWKGSFASIEHGMAVLGLVTLAFVVAAVRLGIDWHALGKGLIPNLPSDQLPRRAYLAVGIMGASISPYLMTFYSSGAVEEEWKPKDLPANRIVAGLGMGFGSCVAGAALVVAAIVLAPAGIKVETFRDAAHVLDPAFASWGFWLFCAALFIGCAGAAFELALDASYILAQSLGWTWGEDDTPSVASRFSMTYSILLLLATTPTLLGVDPLKLTIMSMSITCLALPLVIAPLLVIMNDRRFLEKHTNGHFANAVVFVIVTLAFLLAIVAIPLQWLGGG